MVRETLGKMWCAPDFKESARILFVISSIVRPAAIDMIAGGSDCVLSAFCETACGFDFLFVRDRQKVL